MNATDARSAMDTDITMLVKRLTRELDNFRDIAKYILPTPGDVPNLSGIDVFGGTLPLSGSAGGDHIIYVDFNRRYDLDARIARAGIEGRADVVAELQRCRHRAGLAVVDVAGHRMTDALLAAMFHQAFLLGAIYELDTFGRITRRLFENLNTRFYQSSGAHKFVSMIYGEIAEDSTFRFLSAAMPFPLVYSQRHGRFMDVDPEMCITFPPVGMLPSWDVIDRSTTTSALGFKDHYEMNKWLLMGAGDILLLHTDGLTDHRNGDEAYVPGRLEKALGRVAHLRAREIFEAIKADLLDFAPPSDDVSLVVIKRA